MRFNSILVANRGEIACRIMQTAQFMGIKCVAVFVDADKDAPFVKMADEAIKLSSSYMDGSAIIDAAKQSGAEAIHPGYGFLSENAAFARKVKSNKLIWIGPSPHVIKVMGDKLKAKEIAEKSGVPTLPMTSNTKDVKSIGYPILIKAAAGGGGKGMRIVEKESELKDSIVSAKREALSGFGDDRIFIERYVTKFDDQVIVDWEESRKISFYNLEGESQSKNFQIEIDYSPSNLINLRFAYNDYDVKAEYINGYLRVPMIAKTRFFSNISFESERNTKGAQWRYAVSYTHLTLPTNREV